MARKTKSGGELEFLLCTEGKPRAQPPFSQVYQQMKEYLVFWSKRVSAEQEILTDTGYRKISLLALEVFF